MKNKNIQLSLYINSGIEIHAFDISRKILEIFPVAGEPSITPENAKLPAEALLPTFSFTTNPNMIIIGNNNYLTISLSNDELETYIKKMLDFSKIFFDNNVSFYRVGIVENILCDIKNKDLFMKEYLKKGIIEEAEDIEISWLSTIETDNKKLNCWKRFITNRNANNKLNVIVDINTKENEKNDITYEFLNIFLENSKVEMDNIVNKYDK